MEIFSMLFRSILSYSIFLASRKIVKDGAGLTDNLKYKLKLHRCTNCWRLYSGEIDQCDFCLSETKPLYHPYHEAQVNYSHEEREGMERQVYNDTRNFKFKPIRDEKSEVKYDRHTRRAN